MISAGFAVCSFEPRSGKDTIGFFQGNYGSQKACLNHFVYF
jgi:hypothetical protein